ncbi:Cof-type HAD-IIB family hydrolase [Pontibacter ruber]|uniref:Cof-type HAD-IIB family hydrolase n=1 Tax=Pontibacter ruber TaxID=1343895 RepID=A0ABW5CTJ8_9BACT|nr:Cof-type HAD-IIB family hydrolase [Pontibacter ruber]
MNYRALCTDIDGTLLDSRRELSERTIKAIRNLDKQTPVILASSRMPSAMRHLQQELNILHHPLICFNGGYVLSFESGSITPAVINTIQIPATLCLAIVALAHGTSIHVSLYANDDWHAPQMDQWTEKEQRVTKVSAQVTELHPILDNWQMAGTGAHKVMCMGPEEEIFEMATKLEAQFADQIHIYRSKSTYLEIAPKAISKATALELVLRHQFNIDISEVVAFGDNYNDIDMLRAAGLGIAVGNAREEVKAVADEITLNSIEDGVAVAIEKYFL